MRTYEGMFLFDPSFATDMGKVETEVGRLMERADAQIIMCNRWDERKLAYEIKGRKRGLYVLAFFRADPERIKGIERDVQLSEVVLRVLILRADYMTEEDMQKAYTLRSHPGDRRARPGEEKPASAPRGDAPPGDAQTPAAGTEGGKEAAGSVAAQTSDSNVSAAASAVATPEPEEQPDQPQQ